MNEENPFAQPQASLELDDAEQASSIKILSTEGRIGRLRYLAYIGGSGFVVSILAGALLGLAASIEQEMASLIISAIAMFTYGVSFIYVIIWTIRRVRDINLSAWYTLLFFVPLVNFALWFIPGTAGKNRFGPQPPDNGVGVSILAFAPALFVILGIAAAIMVPAVNDYAGKAKVHEGILLSQPHRTALGIACSEGPLPVGASHERLGLVSAQAASGEGVRAVHVEVLSPTEATVRIVYVGITTQVETGDQELIYTGTCKSEGMFWEVSGTLPKRFWSNL